MKAKLIASTPASVLRRVAGGLGTTGLALALAVSLHAADKTAESTPAEPQTLRVVVLPFQNTTSDAAWDDWRQALPELVRLYLGRTGSTRMTGWKETQPRLARAGWTAASAMDAKLAREMQLFLTAGELAEARKRADGFKPVKQPAATPQK